MTDTAMARADKRRNYYSSPRFSRDPALAFQGTSRRGTVKCLLCGRALKYHAPGMAKHREVCKPGEITA